MKITGITAQVKNPDRVNILVDGKYRFSLDIYQVVELGIKVGNDYSDEELTELERESVFGKVYSRALEYCLMRPHSSREVRDYLWRKTRDTKTRSRQTGELVERQGVGTEVTDRVFERLVEKGHVDDAKFARFWVENRNQSKGISARKLVAELRSKGVEQTCIDEAMQNRTREEKGELEKVIAKKRARYPDEQKFMAYLLRQGFAYDDVREALSDSD